MSSPLADAFCLRERRRNFQINVRSSPEDRRVYFGRGKLNEELVRNVKQKYAMGVPPKMYLYGLYGAGKTHTLYNLKYRLQEDENADLPYSVHCCIIEGEFKKKTSYAYLHGQMMEAIGLDGVRGVIQRYLQQHAASNLAERLRELFGDSNVAKAMHSLGLGAQDITLWKWLCAGKVSATELGALGLTKNMDTVGEMTTTLVSLCRLFQEEKKNYLFMLDEMEGLANVVDDDCRTSFHDAIRKLADDENDSAGFIVSVYAGKESDIPEFLLRPDIVSRIGRENIHDLAYLQDPGDVEKFMGDLFALVVDEDKRTDAEARGEIPPNLRSYPFTDDAKSEFVEHAIQAPTASLPRNIIKAVNECAVEAMNQGSRAIDTAHLGPARTIFVEEEE